MLDRFGLAVDVAVAGERVQDQDRVVARPIQGARALVRVADQRELGSRLGAEWGEILDARFDFRANFEPRIISGEVQCQKPEPAIYQVLLRASGIAGENIAFIDDRRENLAVAHEFGMTTIHYQREPDQHPFEPDYTIQRLSEVLALLC